MWRWAEVVAKKLGRGKEVIDQAAKKKAISRNFFIISGIAHQ